jgi:hypothetical protein
MAYYTTPSNYNYGYYPAIQPMAIQQPMMYPQQQTQMIEQQPNMFQSQMSGISQSNSYFAWVQGEAGAKSYPVHRGTTVPLFDSEGDFVYFKTVDNNGIPLPLVTKVLSDPPVEVASEVVQTKIEESPQPQIDMSNYVTKEKYDEMKKKYTDLEFRVLELESKPSTTPSISSTFTGNTFNNTRKDGNDNGSKFTV